MGVGNGTARVRRVALWGTVTLAGGLALAVEMSLARLLRPWLGDWLGVWAGIIGFVLLYLAVGNALGGRWSRRGNAARLGWILLAAGVGVYTLPLVARPLLILAMRGVRTYNVALPVAALAVIFLLLAWPLTLLGTVTPLAIRELTPAAERSGDVAGRALALSTLGSLAGAFLPVFLLLPALGTRRTFALLGLVAVATAAGWGMLLRQRALAVSAAVLMLLGLMALPAWTAGPVKGVDPAGRARVLYEEESAYTFIQVLEWEGERWLRLNEGEGLHSVWRPGPGLSEGIWDYFLLAPYFRSRDAQTFRPRRVLIIGLAGGTVAHLYTRAFGPVPMVGVELDPAIIRVAYRYFDLGRLPTLRPVAMDGRLYLTLHDTPFDVILIDAYRPPYIPFHLVTVEFFRLVRARLTPDGVVAVNVARTASDRRLVTAVAATMAAVFPAVFVVDEPLNGARWGNSLVIAVRQPIGPADVWANLARSDNPYIQEMARRARGHIYPAQAREPVFTDDRAPVESLVHSIMARALMDRGQPRPADRAHR